VRHIDDRERRARLVARHHLESSAGSIEQVAGDLVGLHSSDPATVYLSLWARMASFEAADLEEALYERRSLLRLLAMRRTMFVVPVELAPVLQRSCTDALVPAERRKLVALLAEAGTSDDIDAWIARLEDETLAALAEHGALPASALTKLVPDLGQRLAVAEGKPYAGTIGVSTRLLFLMSAEGRLARGRPLGSWVSSQYRWSTMDAWIGELPPMPATEARAELVRRWLRTFGPGTTDDLAWWTKWTKADVRAALTSVGAVAVTVERGATDGEAAAWVLSDDVEPPATSAQGPAVNLLPSLDPTAMGWRERDWYIGIHRPALFDRNGNIGPTIWVDGRIVGVWSIRAGGAVVTRLLEPVAKPIVRRVVAEATRLTEWLDGVRVIPRFPTPLEKELAGR
jgi:hypothetical protein